MVVDPYEMARVGEQYAREQFNLQDAVLTQIQTKPEDFKVSMVFAINGAKVSVEVPKSYVENYFCGQNLFEGEPVDPDFSEGAAAVGIDPAEGEDNTVLHVVKSNPEE